jgi:hypothetical protein
MMIVHVPAPVAEDQNGTSIIFRVSGRATTPDEGGVLGREDVPQGFALPLRGVLV